MTDCLLHALILASTGASVPHAIPNEVLQTLAFALAAGAFLSVIAKRLRVPAIVFLLLGGVILGPEGWNVIRPDSLGASLNVLVSLSVGLILFEGGLTLDTMGYRSAGSVIRRLLTLGVLTTWLATSVAVYLLFRWDPTICMLAGSLVIVTGPTVIQPILKRIRLNWNLHHTLHWESVLIDPIGVFAALMAFEWAVGGGGGEALSNLALRVLGGLAIGTIGGEITCFLLKRRLIPEEVLNVFIVGVAVLIFGLTEAIISEGGLLSVTVAGLTIGARRPPELKTIIEFKSVLIDLLIGFVFLLLTARLEVVQFLDFGLRGYLLVAAVILIVRPLTIAVCTFRSEMNLRERLFLSWVAPRGVVAATMASLVALSLEQINPAESAAAAFLETFVYSVIIITVILQGFSAGPVATLLNVRLIDPKGWLIVGAHNLARSVATFLRDVRQVPVVLVDGNRAAVLEAQQEDLPALFADAREVDELFERDEIQGIGRLLAFTDNEDLNELLCKKWEVAFGKQNVYRWASTQSKSGTSTGTVLWNWMPKPSMISSELVLGEAAMVEMEGEPVQSGGLDALLTVNASSLLLDPAPDSRLKADKTTPKTLYLQREADYLISALSPEFVLRIHAESKEGVFEQMIEAVTRVVPGLDAAAIHREILATDAAMPVSLGHGVAIPHTRIRGLARPLCVATQLRPPIDFDPEGKDPPVALVFLLLSPENTPEIHLAVLGEIARLVADPKIRQQLIDCVAPDEMMGIIRRYRRQHTPFADVQG